MVSDLFSSLLQELAKVLKIKTLQPDANNVCLINFPDKISVQLELDKSLRFLIMGTTLGEVTAGPYRESVFKEALKANGQPPPHVGEFAYSKQTNKLVLTKMLPVDNLNGDQIALALTPFLEKAKIWKTSLERGDVPSALQGSFQSSGSGGMFGLK